jgi:hypothetical protein
LESTGEEAQTIRQQEEQDNGNDNTTRVYFKEVRREKNMVAKTLQVWQGERRPKVVKCRQSGVVGCHRHHARQANDEVR